jgi:hypothetical protein
MQTALPDTRRRVAGSLTTYADRLLNERITQVEDEDARTPAVAKAG